MRPSPTFTSILAVMAATLVLALNLALGRAFYDLGSIYADHVVGVFAMTTVLMLGWLAALRDLAHRGRTGAFLPGFLAFGGGAVLLYILAFLLAPEQVIVPYVRGVLLPVGLLLLDFGPGASEFAWKVAIALAFLAPQLLLALLGGWLSSRWGIALVRGPRGAGGPPSSSGPGGPFC
jgi:hypothetical protein